MPSATTIPAPRSRFGPDDDTLGVGVGFATGTSWNGADDVIGTGVSWNGWSTGDMNGWCIDGITAVESRGGRTWRDRSGGAAATSDCRKGCPHGRATGSKHLQQVPAPLHTGSVHGIGRLNFCNGLHSLKWTYVKTVPY